MSLLGTVYESARINVPAALLPQRRMVVAWNALDPEVTSELANLAWRIDSLVSADAARLANHHRVIGEFNRGLRAGYVAGGVATAAGNGPYQWGHEIGQRAIGGSQTGPATIKQLITATDLIAYEFGQLDQAHNATYDFVVHNVGAQRADELGALAVALPTLIDYRRAIVESILGHDEFPAPVGDPHRSPAPAHLEYLTRGIVALFDPSADGWTRVAANMGLAALPFADGTRLGDKHLEVPAQAVDTVLRAPIAAHCAVRRQVDRVRLARRWSAPHALDVSIDADGTARATLWDVYQVVPASRIRGGDARFGDLVTGNLVHRVSRYLESAIPPGQKNFPNLIRHFQAIRRGFDSRVEGVVDIRALASAGCGRTMSEELRRFVGGGPIIASVSANLQELGATLNELHHALDNPVDFVRKQLEASDESPLAAALLALFRANPALPRQLFGEGADLEFFWTNHVNTCSAHDLLRSALFHVTRAVRPEPVIGDGVASSLARARADLERIRKLDTTASHGGGDRILASHRGTKAKARNPVHGGVAENLDVAAHARLFEEDFEFLVRLTRRLIYRLHHARTLAGASTGRLEAGTRAAPARGADAFA